VKYFIILLVGFNLINCNTTNVSPPREPVVVKDTLFCKDAEIHLTELSCEIAKPTKKGLSFEEFCKQTQDSGIFINPKCLSSIASCDQNLIDQCTNSR